MECGDKFEAYDADEYAAEHCSDSGVDEFDIEGDYARPLLLLSSFCWSLLACSALCLCVGVASRVACFLLALPPPSVSPAFVMAFIGIPVPAAMS